jgi:hypothetical protein
MQNIMKTWLLIFLWLEISDLVQNIGGNLLYCILVLIKFVVPKFFNPGVETHYVSAITMPTWYVA